MPDMIPNTIKKLRIDPKMKNNDQNVCWYELINILILTITTSAQNIKFPSRVSPPTYP